MSCVGGTVDVGPPQEVAGELRHSSYLALLKKEIDLPLDLDLLQMHWVPKSMLIRGKRVQLCLSNPAD